MEDAFEDWVRRNNNWVDHAVGVTNVNRPLDLLTLQTEAIHFHESVASRMHQLRKFYFCVASLPKTSDASETPTDIAAEHDIETQFSLTDLYRYEIQQLLLSQPDHAKVPTLFVSNLLHWLFDRGHGDSVVYDLCFEELALALAADDFAFQFWNPQASSMDLSLLSTRYEEATLSYCFLC